MKYPLTFTLIAACIIASASPRDPNKKWKNCWAGSKELVEKCRNFNPNSDEQTSSLLSEIEKMKNKLSSKSNRKRKIIASKLNKIEFLIKNSMNDNTNTTFPDLPQFSNLSSLLDEFEKEEKNVVDTILIRLKDESLSTRTFGVATLTALISEIEKGKDNLRQSREKVSNEINSLKVEVAKANVQNAINYSHKNIREEIFDLCQGLELRYGLK